MTCGSTIHTATTSTPIILSRNTLERGLPAYVPRAVVRDYLEGNVAMGLKYNLVT